MEKDIRALNVLAGGCVLFPESYSSFQTVSFIEQPAQVYRHIKATLMSMKYTGAVKGCQEANDW